MRRQREHEPFAVAQLLVTLLEDVEPLALHRHLSDELAQLLDLVFERLAQVLVGEPVPTSPGPAPSAAISVACRRIAYREVARVPSKPASVAFSTSCLRSFELMGNRLRPEKATMRKNRLAAAGLCLAFSIQPVLADDWFAPALPQCKAAGEFRTPMPMWSPEVTDANKLSSEPPAGNGRIVYIELLADDDDVHCTDAPASESYTFTFPAGNKAESVEVNIRGPAQYVNGAMCSFTGFYVSEAADREGQRQTNFRPVDKFDVMSSGLFCRGRWTHAAPSPSRPR